ncbi:MAG: NAD-dependent epimerase/dehydratase family protein [Actinobacteria bacterium]|nr:NAD-dependent epimerase/dehydratase family protein [Actinomycetota bacterium]
MAHVAVTGGAGFIGSNLVGALVLKGHTVSVIDDLSTGLLSNINTDTSRFHQVSLADAEGVKKAIIDAEVIFHLGARGSVPRSLKNPIATHDVNATGTLNVLEVARATGAHLFFSSSSSVYGRNGVLPKDESMWLGPMTPYAASKLAAEAYVQAYGTAYNVPVTLLRFFNVFGPKQRPDHEYAAVLPKWIWKAMHDEPIEVFGDGSQSRDFTYVKTVVDICLDAMERKVTHDGAINLAYGNRISLLETIEMLRKYFPNLQVNFMPIRPGDVKESQNSPVLLKQLFPDVLPMDFEKALSETVDWLKAFGETVANGPTVSD